MDRRHSMSLTSVNAVLSEAMSASAPALVPPPSEASEEELLSMLEEQVALQKHLRGAVLAADSTHSHSPQLGPVRSSLAPSPSQLRRSHSAPFAPPATATQLLSQGPYSSLTTPDTRPSHLSFFGTAAASAGEAEADAGLEEHEWTQSQPQPLIDTPEPLERLRMLRQELDVVQSANRALQERLVPLVSEAPAAVPTTRKASSAQADMVSVPGVVFDAMVQLLDVMTQKAACNKLGMGTSSIPPTDDARPAVPPPAGSDACSSSLHCTFCLLSIRGRPNALSTGYLYVFPWGIHFQPVASASGTVHSRTGGHNHTEHESLNLDEPPHSQWEDTHTRGPSPTPGGHTQGQGQGQGHAEEEQEEEDQQREEEKEEQQQTQQAGTGMQCTTLRFGDLDRVSVRVFPSPPSAAATTKHTRTHVPAVRHVGQVMRKPLVVQCRMSVPAQPKTSSTHAHRSNASDTNSSASSSPLPSFVFWGFRDATLSTREVRRAFLKHSGGKAGHNKLPSSVHQEKEYRRGVGLRRLSGSSRVSDDSSRSQSPTASLGDSDPGQGQGQHQHALLGGAPQPGELQLFPDTCGLRGGQVCTLGPTLSDASEQGTGAVHSMLDHAERAFHTALQPWAGQWKLLDAQDNWELYLQSIKGQPALHKCIYVVDAPPALVFLSWHELSNRCKWDDELLRSSYVVKQLDPITDVVHHVFKQGSLVAKRREFIDVRRWKELPSGVIVETHAGVAGHTDAVVSPSSVIGHNQLYGVLYEPVGRGLLDVPSLAQTVNAPELRLLQAEHSGKTSHPATPQQQGQSQRQRLGTACRVTFVAQTNAKGWVPQAIIDNHTTGLLREFPAKVTGFVAAMHGDLEQHLLVWKASRQLDDTFDSAAAVGDDKGVMEHPDGKVETGEEDSTPTPPRSPPQ